MRKLPEAERIRRARESRRQWRIKNPDICRAHAKKWKALNPEKVSAMQKRQRARAGNRQHRTEIQRKWMAKNKDRLNARHRERLATEPGFRLRKALGCRINKAVRRKKTAGTLALVGCDIVFLMGYLEARFKPGMKWDNYASVWEIDHRIPCAAYDLTDPSHQRSCFHYTNLQPMFCSDNRSKSDKLPGTHQLEII